MKALYDGRGVVSVFLYDAATLESKKRIDDLKYSIVDLTFTADEKVLVVAAPGSGKPLPGPGNAERPDSKSPFFGGLQLTSLDTESGAVVEHQFVSPGGSWNMLISHDARMVAAMGSRGIDSIASVNPEEQVPGIVWDESYVSAFPVANAAQAPFIVLPGNPLLFNFNRIIMAWSPDNVVLAVPAEGAILLWSPANPGSGIKVIPAFDKDLKATLKEGYASLDFSPDGKFLVGSSKDNVSVWSIGQ